MAVKYQTDRTPTENLYLALFGELPAHDIEKGSLAEVEFSQILARSLTEREVETIMRYFGIDMPRETFKTIGEHFGVSGSRAGEIMKTALRRLRSPIRTRRIKRLFASRAELLAEIHDLEELLESHKKQVLIISEGLAKSAKLQACYVGSPAPAYNESKPESADFLRNFPVNIEELDFSTRTYRCLMRSQIYTVFRLLEHSIEDLTRVRNLGRLGIIEITEKLRSLGISLRES